MKEHRKTEAVLKKEIERYYKTLKEINLTVLVPSTASVVLIVFKCYQAQ